MSDAVSSPTRPPTRSTATERTCSVCALESRGSPESEAGKNTWNGYTRVTFDVSGTTVMTPRLTRDAVVLAPSLLTITAGRRLLANRELAALRRMFRLEKNTMLSQTDAVASEKGVGSVRPQMIEERSRGLFSKAHASRIEDGGT